MADENKHWEYPVTKGLLKAFGDKSKKLFLPKTKYVLDDYKWVIIDSNLGINFKELYLKFLCLSKEANITAPVESFIGIVSDGSDITFASCVNEGKHTIEGVKFYFDNSNESSIFKIAVKLTGETDACSIYTSAVDAEEKEIIGNIQFGNDPAPIEYVQIGLGETNKIGEVYNTFSGSPVSFDIIKDGDEKDSYPAKTEFDTIETSTKTKKLDHDLNFKYDFTYRNDGTSSEPIGDLSSLDLVLPIPNLSLSDLDLSTSKEAGSYIVNVVEENSLRTIDITPFPEASISKSGGIKLYANGDITTTGIYPVKLDNEGRAYIEINNEQEEHPAIIYMGTVDVYFDADKTGEQTSLQEKTQEAKLGHLYTCRINNQEYIRNNITYSDYDNNNWKDCWEYVGEVFKAYTPGEHIAINENRQISTTGLQETLTEGENIHIDGNTISATDTTYEASDFDIKDLTDSTNLRTSWSNKQDAINDLEAIRSGASLGATALQSIPSEYIIESELNEALSEKQDVISDLNTIRSGAELGATALLSFTENDPTVPNWAKEPNKPSYTLDEVDDGTNRKLENTATLQVVDKCGSDEHYLTTSENPYDRITFTGGQDKFTISDGSESFDVSITHSTPSIANNSVAGLVKSSTTGNTPNRDYNVEVNSDGTMKVNVPWTESTLSPASKNSLGGIKLVSNTKAGTEIESITTTSDRTYAVLLNENDLAVVNVPWESSSVTLNGVSSTNPSFYAPNSAGSSGLYLKSNGIGSPSWENFPAYTDTKNTTGATESRSQELFIIGAAQLQSDLQTYTNSDIKITSNNTIAIRGHNVLTDNDVKSVLVSTSTSDIPSSAAVATYVANNSAGALVYRGTLGNSTGLISSLPTVHSKGDYYIVGVEGDYVGTGSNLSVGSLIICKTSSTDTTQHSDHWDVIPSISAVNSDARTALSLNGGNYEISVGTVNGVSLDAKITMPSKPEDVVKHNSSTSKRPLLASNVETPTDGSAYEVSYNTNVYEQSGALYATSIGSNSTKIANGYFTAINGSTVGTSPVFVNSASFSDDNGKKLTLTGGVNTSTTTATIPVATANTFGVVKSTTLSSPTTGRYYDVEVDNDGTMRTNVPWTNSSYSFATGDSDGLIKITPYTDGVAGTATNISIKNVATSTNHLHTSNTTDELIVHDGSDNDRKIKKSGKTITTDAPSSSSTDSSIPTSAAVWTAIGNGIASNDAMIYKGTISGGDTGLYGALTAAANRGWTYKVSTAGKINGKLVEVGDILICNTDDTVAATSSNYTTIAAKWDVIQNNITGALFKELNTFVNEEILVADGTEGKVKCSGKTIETSLTSNSNTKVPTSKAVADYVENGEFSIKTKVGDNDPVEVADFTANQSSNDDVTFIQGDKITLTSDTTNRTITIAHADTSTQPSVNNTGTRTYIQNVILDEDGHVTGLTTATETVVDTNTATAADDIFDGSNNGTEIKYAPYSTQQNKLSFDTSNNNPSRTDRLNLNGYLYATKLYSGGNEVLTTGSNNHTVTVISGKKSDGITDITATSSSSANPSVTLGDSGVTAGSYGDSSALTPDYGNTFKVPYIKVNDKGIVTEVSDHNVLIPASDNSDKNVEQKSQLISGYSYYRPLLVYGGTGDNNTPNSSSFTDYTGNVWHFYNLFALPSTGSLFCTNLGSSAIPVSTINGVPIGTTPKFTDSTYKFTIGSTTYGDSDGTSLGALSSETAENNGTTLSLVTTGEKFTWNNKITSNTSITGATKCKITYDSKGLVTSGDDLSTSDIPNLATSKITALTGYQKGSSTSALSTSDSLNDALGKLENKLDGKQNTSTAVTHSTSTAVGSATQPVYIASDGTAIATTYSLSQSVPNDAVFTDTKNTAGSNDNTSKLYLIGTTSLTTGSNSSLTYSNSGVYATDGTFYTKNIVLNEGSLYFPGQRCDISYDDNIRTLVIENDDEYGKILIEADSGVNIENSDLTIQGNILSYSDLGYNIGDDSGHAFNLIHAATLHLASKDDDGSGHDKNYGGKITFGDDELCYIKEDPDDELKIHSNKELYLSTSNASDIYIEPASNTVNVSGKINASGGFFQTSDARKKNIKSELSLDKAYELIDKCLTIVYSLKDSPDKEEIGLIAQEVQRFFPEIISEDKEGMLSLDYAKLTVVILRVLKDLIEQIKILKK